MPKAKPEFTRVIVARLTPETEALAKAKAKSEGLTLSQWVRSLVYAAIGYTPKARPNRPQKEK